MGIAGFKAVEVMDSTPFCGTACHSVMAPEYANYLRSPHARVDCVDCHIGKGFIATRITRKAGDVKHIIATAFVTYEYPIRAGELRPARETCELCHSPQKFSDDSLRTIATYGDILFPAIEAAQLLAAEGIRAEVIDLYSVKPFDREGLLKSLDKTGALVVAENHQKRNGLGYELSNFCLKNKVVPFDNLGLEDTFAESGSYGKLLEKYGLSKTRIAEAAKRLLRRA